MRMPADYKTAQAFDGNSMPQLPVGGHMCSLRNVTNAVTQNGAEYLEVMFDIFEPGEWNGYYQRVFEMRKGRNPNAAWPGRHSIFIYTQEGKCSGFFKGFIEAVEASNPGYSFEATGFNEMTLQGKRVGFNFREEEYEYTDSSTGEIKTGVAVRPYVAISIKKVQEGVVPPKRKPLTQKNNSGGYGGGGYGYQQSAAPTPPMAPPADDYGGELPF